MNDEVNSGLGVLFGEVDETDDIIKERMVECHISKENYDDLAIIAGVFNLCGIEYSILDVIDIAIGHFLANTKETGSINRIYGESINFKL